MARDNQIMENYLSAKRGISKETISAWENRGLIYQDSKDNVVFLVRDFYDKVRYYHQKGTKEEERYVHDAPSETSSKSNGVVFENKGARFLYVAEAAIDAMSLVDILGGPEMTKDSSFLSLQSAGNSSALARYLSTRDTSKLEAIFLCQDADSAGEESVEKCKTIIEKFQSSNRILNTINVSRLSPKTGYKDFNEELYASKRLSEKQALSRSPTVEMSRTPSLSIT